MTLLLPSLPAACASAAERLPRLSPAHQKILSSPDADLHQLARWIDTDPALCSYMLRVANSPFYGLPHRIETTSDAAMILGRAALTSICAAAMLRAISMPVHVREFDPDTFWRQSVMVACLSAQAAPFCKAGPESAFSAGLLHGIGNLLAAVSGGLHGSTMEALGASMAASWHLPESIVEAILHSAQPSASAPLSIAVHFGRSQLIVDAGTAAPDLPAPFPTITAREEAVAQARLAYESFVADFAIGAS